MKHMLRFLIVAPLSMILVPGFICLGVSFDTLGDLPGGYFSSEARGVSEDGMIVVGRSISSGLLQAELEAFKWEFGTMKGLGYFDDDSKRSYAEAISSDGKTIVGGGDSASGTHAMIWDSAGMHALTDLPFSLATCVSPNGDIIAGYSQTAKGAEAFYWKKGVVKHMGTSSDDNLINSAVNAMSPDGWIMVGKQHIEYNYHYSVYWDLENDPAILQHKLDTSLAEAFGISADKSIAVGHERNMAVYWPVEIGARYKWLPEPNFNAPSEARDVSSDGSLIVGWRSNPVPDPDHGSEAMLWWRTLIGSEWIYVAENLNDHLDANGVDRNGFFCEAIYDVTDNGRTVVGSGKNSDGNTEAFRVRLGLTGLGGYHLETDGRTLQTGIFLGQLDVSLAPWIWCYNAGHWFYLSEPVAEAGRGWIYVADIITLNVRMMDSDHIGYSFDMEKWLYINPAVIAAGHGWVFML